MNNILNIVVWNNNTLQQRIQELFIHIHEIDILISETHFINKNYVKILHYSIYHTKHLSGRVHEETAVIKNTISHHFTQDHFTSISIGNNNNNRNNKTSNPIINRILFLKA